MHKNKTFQVDVCSFVRELMHKNKTFQVDVCSFVRELMHKNKTFQVDVCSFVRELMHRNKTFEVDVCSCSPCLKRISYTVVLLTPLLDEIAAWRIIRVSASS